jgi:hypothetical protein
VSEELSFSNMALSAFPIMLNLGSAKTISLSNVSFNAADAGMTVGFDSVHLQWLRLKSVRKLEVVGCRGLTSIGPFPSNYTVAQLSNNGVEAVPASIVILDNENLTSVNLKGYSGVRTDVNIQHNSPNLNVSTDIVTGSIRLRSAQSLAAIGLKSLLPFPGSSEENPLFVDNTTIRTLNLPELVTIADGTTLQISGNTYLSSLLMPKLSSGGGLEITGNSELATVTLNALSSVQTLKIQGPVERYAHSKHRRLPQV